ncbi:jg24147 [Pararge aegeria aegeria]|uniref:Jg24147 protein n=1 Tax=Pararge aegeria aegeria TaxID=348720 RepID=A0A8S4R1F2_9NEOP|nr:jg24147 [Pararge aegeria aegeria]
MFMGGGDHLPSGDPLARLPAINIKKKKAGAVYSLKGMAAAERMLRKAALLRARRGVGAILQQQTGQRN